MNILLPIGTVLIKLILFVTVVLFTIVTILGAIFSITFLVLALKQGMERMIKKYKNDEDITK